MRIRSWLSVFVAALFLATAALAGSLPANVRPDLGAQWQDGNGNLLWPPNDGVSGTATPVVLVPGMVLDRFGSDGGRFFSPKGASYGGRALPYVCDVMPYKVYRVVAPVLAWTGKAAPWFDQPGGATQFQTDAPVYALIADKMIEAVTDPGPAPCK